MLLGYLEIRNELEWAGGCSFIYRGGNSHGNWAVIEMKVFCFEALGLEMFPDIPVWIKHQGRTCIQKDNKNGWARDELWKEIKEGAQVSGMDLKGMV